jgi:ethanolamine utilization microcompartment shell protein EutS
MLYAKHVDRTSGATAILEQYDSDEESEVDDTHVLGRNLEYSTCEGCDVFVASAFYLSCLN